MEVEETAGNIKGTEHLADVTTDSNPDDSPVTNKTPNPTVEEVKEWDKDQLLNWIQEFRPKLLTDDDDVEKFKAAKISGEVFLMLAGDVDSFERKCHLPFGPNRGLAELAKELGGGVKQVNVSIFDAFPKGIDYHHLI